MEDVQVINTENRDGQTKCPQCGSSRVHYDIEKRKLVCEYCQNTFEYQKIHGKKIASHLEGNVVGLASQKIDPKASGLVTLKCDGCGAEIVVNTEETLNVKCHWCGSDLSINHQVDNGMVPDEILPFILTREQAFDKIYQFSKDQLTFSTDEFRKNLKPENIHGVFFPYLLLDVKAHGHFKGFGEHTVKTYYGDDNESNRYDVDRFHVEREFNLAIEDLTMESNSTRIDKFDKTQWNNVIDAVSPFDTYNGIQFNANYMRGYTSEKRDLNISELEEKADYEVKDIARHRINETLKHYDRGVRWDYEGIQYTGKQWLSAYLPVWLYSCYDKKGVIHYIAVNGRTGETVGTIPFDRKKLSLTILFSFLGTLLVIACFFGLMLLFPSLVFIVLFIASLLVGFGISIFLLILFIVEDIKFSHFKWIRHSYETETLCNLDYIDQIDEKTEFISKTYKSSFDHSNNHKLYGEYVKINKNPEE